MTTNQTIDGVPRELLADCVAYLQGSHRAEVNICIRLLRDLLERDADRSAIPGAHEFKDAPLPTKADYQRLGAALNGIIEPAAQPQGEQVGMLLIDEYFDNRELGEVDVQLDPKVCERLARDYPGQSLPLYAEQPAPVAVVIPERVAADHLNEIAQGWNACLDELKRLNPSL